MPKDLFEKTYEFYSRPQEFTAMGLMPFFQPIARSHGNVVEIKGKQLILTGSNNYLDLAHHPHVIEAGKRALEHFGSGCTGSRFLTGTMTLHEELEERLAKFFGREAVLTVTTGYQTNLAAISGLCDREDIIYLDREDHACIFDGARLSMAEVRKFRHNDFEQLDRMLTEDAEKRGGRLVVVDGVYSMSGDICPLDQLVKVCKKHGAKSMVDDAHATGVLGKNGRGTAEHFGVEDEIDLIVGTFSKSFASVGGFVAGKKEVIQYIKFLARPFIFTAAANPASVATTIAALDILEAEPDRRERLWANRRQVAEGFAALGLDTLSSKTPIIPVKVGEMMTAFQWWRGLFDAGVFTTPAIPPAVPEKGSLIRTSYTAGHTREQLDHVIAAFEQVSKTVGVTV